MGKLDKVSFSGIADFVSEVYGIFDGTFNVKEKVGMFFGTEGRVKVPQAGLVMSIAGKDSGSGGDVVDFHCLWVEVNMIAVIA